LREVAIPSKKKFDIGDLINTPLIALKGGIIGRVLHENSQRDGDIAGRVLHENSPLEGGQGGVLRSVQRILASLFLFATFASAQTFSLDVPSSDAADQVVQAKLLSSLDKAYRGGTLRVAVVAQIQEGWHINSNRPLEEYLIPTELKFDSTSGVTLEQVVFPKALERTFAFSETPLAVFEGEFVIGAVLKISEQVAGENLKLNGKLHYQACNDVACMAPANATFSAEIPLARVDQPASLQHPEIFSKIDFGATSTTEASTATTEQTSELEKFIAERGLATSFVFIFLWGLALNLTPCVYPLIPITTSYFAGQSTDRSAKVFSLALVYVLGMALMYSMLGMLAATSGALFGAALQSPAVLIFIALVMIGLALSMFGLYEIRVPMALTNFAGGSRAGYFGALFMGLTMGIVAAPCIGPVVLGLLTYVAKIADPVLGFWMFFVLALGLGVPYLILGTFSGLLNKLPRSGMWMVWVKKVFGVMLLAMAIYFVQPILPAALKQYLLAGFLLLGGIYIGFIEASKFSDKIFPWIKRFVFVAFAGVAVWLAWPEAQAHASHWKNYDEAALQAAQREAKPVIIDFTAEWCLACKELEKFTFPHEEVMKRADRFVFLRADLTHISSAPVQEILARYDIKGLPTVIFLNGEGREVATQRVIGFVDGKNFAQRMDAVAPLAN
jgi:thiol:disulfide interchange protein DsbD